MICLGTSVIIAAINRRIPNIRRRLEKELVKRTPIGVPVIALYEIFYGIKKSTRAEANTAALAAFMTLDLLLWSFEPEDAEEAGDIRAILERAGRPIGPYDVLIAAQSRRRGAILATLNAAEFARVPRLEIDNWGAA